jgi:TRAP-type mannitol/chloroaromatic compound transport system permease small subunit
MIVGHQEASATKVRVIAILLLLLEIGIMFAYGFGTFIDMAYANNANSDNSAKLIFYLLAAILPILGWGLIIAYS